MMGLARGVSQVVVQRLVDALGEDASLTPRLNAGGFTGGLNDRCVATGDGETVLCEAVREAGCYDKCEQLYGGREGYEACIERCEPEEVTVG